MFNDATKIDDYSMTVGCCIYGFLIYISWLLMKFSYYAAYQKLLYLSHDTLQKFKMPIHSNV